MKILNLKYCIESKNEYSETNNVCSCYRSTIDLFYDFEMYRVSYCNHWKQYIINKKLNKLLDKCSETYFEDNQDAYRMFVVFLCENILCFKDISLERPLLPKEYKNIRQSDLYFYEPVFSCTSFDIYHLIYITDFIELLYSDYTDEEWNELLNSRYSFSFFSDSPHFFTLKVLKYSYSYLFRQCDSRAYKKYREAIDRFITIINMINKHYHKRISCTYLELAQSLLTLKTKLYVTSK